MVPLPGFPRTRDYLHKAKVTITTWNGRWLAGRMTGAMRLGRENAVEGRRLAAGAMDDGQKICAFFAKEHRADGTC